MAFPSQVSINVYSKKSYWFSFSISVDLVNFMSVNVPIVSYVRCLGYIIIYLVFSVFRHSLLINSHLYKFFM